MLSSGKGGFLKTICYDIEIEAAVLNGQAPELFEEEYPGIRYVQTFGDKKDMGIACLCAQEMETGRMRVFCADNLRAFQAVLDDADVIVTFNGQAFDNPLVELAGLTFPYHKSYDLLAEWLKVARGRVGLDALAEANLGIRKSGEGRFAPIKWQEGKRGEVIDYCSMDVWLTAELYKLVQSQRWLKNPYTGARVEIGMQAGLFQ